MGRFSDRDRVLGASRFDASRVRLVFSVFAALGWVGCPTTESVDTGVRDAGSVDSAMADGGSAEDAVVSRDVGSSDGGAPDALAALSIAGTYMDGFGGSHRVTNLRWEQSGEGFTSGHDIVETNEAGGWLIARNDATNMFSPNLFSRFEWVRVSGTLYYCQSPYDAPTADAARTAPRPDRANPAMSGCGMFAWSTLTPVSR